MLIIVNEACCERKPFESHKKNCYFKRKKNEMNEFIRNLLVKFEQVLMRG